MWATQPNWSDEELARITTPIAVVLGDHDEAILPDHADHMVKVIPGATRIVLPEASHFAMLQAPAEYTAAVRAFIDTKYDRLRAGSHGEAPIPPGTTPGQSTMAHVDWPMLCRANTCRVRMYSFERSPGS